MAARFKRENSRYSYQSFWYIETRTLKLTKKESRQRIRDFFIVISKKLGRAMGKEAFYGDGLICVICMIRENALKIYVIRDSEGKSARDS